MLLAFLLLLIVTVSGLAITYVLDDDAPLWARVCMGAVLGQVMLGTVCFAVASFIGMGVGTVWGTALICALPLALLRRDNYGKKLGADWKAFDTGIKDFISKPSLERTLVSAAYAALIVLMWFFFQRAMFIRGDDIFIGAPNNLGDIAFHLQGIYGFSDGQNFPPQNPSYAGAKFTYPFIVNLVLAMMMVTGARVDEALFWQDIILAVALVGLFYHFTFKLTGNRTAARIAPFLFIFSGGFGFLNFLRDAAASEQGFFGYLMQLPNDYTLRPDSTWRWGNTCTVLLITQRSFLLGIPLGLIILNGIWKLFTDKSNEETAPPEKSVFLNSSLITATVFGLFGGALVLVHAHSFAAIMGMAAILALMSLRNWKAWFLFFSGVALVAVPELLYATIGTAAKAQSFLGLQFGWDNDKQNFFWFWFKNTGMFFPMLFLAIGWLIFNSLKSANDAENQKSKNDNRNLLLFWLPFALCFIIPNVFRLAPWIWDNIKVLIWWFIASIPLVCWALAQIMRRDQTGKVISFALIGVLIFAGFLDVWRIASRAYEYPVFNNAATDIGKQIREKTAPNALIMSAPVYNSPVVLTGRRWFLGFTGHLWTHGINPTEREYIIKRIYAGTEDAPELLRKNGIEYVLVGPNEYNELTVNDNFFARYPVIASNPQYRVYQVK